MDSGCVSYRNALALDIVREFFGDIPHKLVEYLCHNETCSTILDIVKYFKMTGSSITLLQIRESLLSLVHHNCLLVKLNQPSVDLEAQFVPDVEQQYIYHIHFQNILNKLKYPKLVSTVQQQFGPLGATIMEEIVAQGRCKSQALLAAVISTMEQRHGESGLLLS